MYCKRYHVCTSIILSEQHNICPPPQFGKYYFQKNNRAEDFFASHTIADGNSGFFGYRFICKKKKSGNMVFPALFRAMLRTYAEGSFALIGSGGSYQILDKLAANLSDGVNAKIWRQGRVDSGNLHAGKSDDTNHRLAGLVID